MNNFARHQHMQAVDNTPVPAPYPPDIVASGMHFHVDIARMKHSTSWVLCPPAVRPWMVMLWIESWSSTPCGSFEPEDEVIAARIGMDIDFFRLHRKHLMRGWYLADDGFLYHQFITQLVVKMSETRTKDRERMRAYRAGLLLSRVTPPNTGELTPESHASSPVFTPVAVAGAVAGAVGEEKKEIPPRKRVGAGAKPPAGLSLLLSDGVDSQIAEDWLKVRKAKNAIWTITAYEGVRREAAKAGIPVAEAVHIASVNNWAGFKASWLEKPTTQRPAHTSAVDRQIATMDALTGRDRNGTKPGQEFFNAIDVESRIVE